MSDGQGRAEEIADVVVKNLEFSYGKRRVLNGIDLEMHRGEFVAILGPNGAGKSTLVKCISGILNCDGVLVKGKPPGSYKRIELAKIIAYVPQRVEPNFMTVFDNVMLGRRPYMGMGPSNDDFKVVASIIKRMDLERIMLKRTTEVSGGELQKVSIARALAQEPEVLVMDEPTNNLDMKSQLEVMKIARDFSRRGLSIVVMHDVNMAFRFARRFIFMRNGRVIADGGLEILNEELFEEVYDVKVRIEEIGGIPVVVPVD